MFMMSFTLLGVHIRWVHIIFFSQEIILLLCHMNMNWGAIPTLASSNGLLLIKIKIVYLVCSLLHLWDYEIWDNTFLRISSNKLDCFVVCKRFAVEVISFPVRHWKKTNPKCYQVLNSIQKKTNNFT